MSTTEIVKFGQIKGKVQEYSESLRSSGIASLVKDFQHSVRSLTDGKYSFGIAARKDSGRPIPSKRWHLIPAMREHRFWQRKRA